MARLWTRMTAIYGHKWSSSFGDAAIIGESLTETAKVWAMGLINVSPQELSEGLNACMRSGESWPPTLPEFIKLCGASDEIPNWNDDDGYLSLGRKIKSLPSVGETMTRYKNRLKQECLSINRKREHPKSELLRID